MNQNKELSLWKVVSMDCVGIVAEYNPFHNGHLQHMREAFALSHGCRAIVAMSGGFTQRGEPALLDKSARAKTALRMGASVVLELPCAFACAGAEAFARGAVLLLRATGALRYLCFGAETDDAGFFSAAAKILSGEPAAYKERLSGGLNAGMSFARARAAALEGCIAERYGGRYDGPMAAKALSLPNNILAAEYITALTRYAPDVTPLLIKRTGGGYFEDGAASSSYIRKLAARGVDKNRRELERLMPAEALEILAGEISGARAHTGIDEYSLLLHYILINENFKSYIKNDDFSTHIYDWAGREEQSIWGRVLNSADGAGITALTDKAASKRHTKARVRRLIMRRILNLASENAPEYAAPAYIRVLGFRKQDADLLAFITENAALPVVTNLKHADAVLSGHDDARRMYLADRYAQAVYRLGAGPDGPCERPMVVI